MKQFIRYLYEYHNGKRVRNVGFIKVEKQMDKCTIHIHGKGLDFGNERKLEVYIFYVQGERCIGVSQGTLEGGSPVIHYILKFNVEDVGNPDQFEAVDGIVLRNRDGRNYAAVWDEMPVDIERMQMRSQMSETGGAVPGVSEAMKGAESEVSEATEDIEDVEAPSNVMAENVESEETVPHETLLEHVEKMVAEQEVEAAAMREEVDSYIPPSTRTYEKIQRQDISRLPRREWKLANNSFLLHGFYNYHHLLYIEEGDHSWIGVPGIYHEKERTAARAFGFPQFHRITDADLELSEREKNTYDDFGYWCRQVDRQ